jgi:copper ion binding protein
MTRRMILRDANVSIKGMHCRNCQDSIEAKVRSLKGVKSVRVSLLKNRAFVRFDPDRVSLERIKLGVESLGYQTGEGRHPGKRRSIFQVLAFGLIPHVGCIAFLAGSVLGVTVLTQMFRPLLMSRYFFYLLILLSLTFATVSSVIYLRRNDLLSFAGVKRKKNYLFGMYGSTLGINLILLMIVFPLLANVSSQTPVVTGLGDNNMSSIRLGVDIPCSGHAPLITGELKSLKGVVGVKYSLPNIFVVSFDSTKTSREEITSLDIFNTFEATVLELQ